MYMDYSFNNRSGFGKGGTKRKGLRVEKWDRDGKRGEVEGRAIICLKR